MMKRRTLLPANNLMDSQRHNMPSPLRLFYSNSDSDERLRKELESHLRPLQMQGYIEGWHRAQIEAGTELDLRILDELRRADIIILLISADFMVSDFCGGPQIRLAMERHAQGLAEVVPVIVRPIDLTSVPFMKLRTLPRSGKAVSLWSNRDEAWAEVAHDIRKLAETLVGGSSRPASEFKPLSQDASGVDRAPSEAAQVVIRGSVTGSVVIMGNRNTVSLLGEVPALAASTPRRGEYDKCGSKDKDS